MQNSPSPARKGMFAGETLAGFPLLFNNPRCRRAICETNRKGTNQKRTSKWMSSFDWCRWWDSNPHGVATNGFWVRHVYQFHHTGIFDQVPINYITKMGWAQEKNFALFLRKKKNLQKAPWQVKGFHGKVKCFYILIKRARSPPCSTKTIT